MKLLKVFGRLTGVPLALVSLVALAQNDAPTTAETNPPPEPLVEHSGKASGPLSAIGDGARQIGDGVREGAHQIGQAAKQVGTGIGHAARDSARAVGSGARDAAQGVSKATHNAVDEVRPPPSSPEPSAPESPPAHQ
jgi:hypothetical protein